MRYALFLSDMHLDANRADITQLLLSYLNKHGKQAEAIYLLGDIFEVWLGDKVSMPDYADVIDCLKQLSQHTDIFAMRGNRDFLLGKQFANASGVTLLNDPSVIDLFGQATLISHGDQLCTDDVSYQRFRKVVSNRAVQWLALTLIPNKKKRAIARKLRDASKQAQQQKQSAIMDANTDAVSQWFKHFNVGQMIHGHTHRPQAHTHQVNGQNCTRWVLGDWYEQGSVLIAYEDGSFKLTALPLGAA